MNMKTTMRSPRVGTVLISVQVEGTYVKADITLGETVSIEEFRTVLYKKCDEIIDKIKDIATIKVNEAHSS